MQRILLNDFSQGKVFERSLAKGHKSLRFAEGCEIMKPISIATDGDVLSVTREADTEEEEIYTIMCKSFGLVGYHQKLHAKVSIIFCDDGWMLVTLLEGGMVVMVDEKLVLPTVGDFAVPSISEDDIYWVNANSLLGYSEHMGIKGRFMYDVEFAFMLRGTNANGMATFACQMLKDEDRDISLGYIAQYEQQVELQKQQREVKALRDSLVTEDTVYEFEDDEFEDEDDGLIDEDDDDTDW